MKEPTYRDAIRHAWETVTTHKNLWFLGLFATLLGQMGLMELFGNTFVAEKRFIYYPAFFHLQEYAQTVWQGVSGLGFTADKWIWFIWLGLFFLGLALLLAFMAVISQGALIQGITQTFSLLRHRRPVDLSKAWGIGIHHFWRLLGVNFIKKVLFCFFTFLLGFATWNAVTYVHGSDEMIFILTFIVTLILGAILSFLFIYAAAYIVIEGYSLREALEEAWRLFLDHWLVSFEVAAIAILANVFAALLVLGGLVIYIAQMALFWVLKLAFASVLIWQVGFFVGSFIFAAYVVFIGTLLTIFTTALWTYLFVKMHRHGVSSRILHFLGHRS